MKTRPRDHFFVEGRVKIAPVYTSFRLYLLSCCLKHFLQYSQVFLWLVVPQSDCSGRHGAERIAAQGGASGHGGRLADYSSCTHNHQTGVLLRGRCGTSRKWQINTRSPHKTLNISTCSHAFLDVQDLVGSLGKAPNAQSAIQENGDSAEVRARPATSLPCSLICLQERFGRRRAMTDTTALADVLNEFVSTERTYVKKLQSLKRDYADPLRKFARSKDTAIIPPYEAKTLFGNIDNLLPVNEAFLADLEIMMSEGGIKAMRGIGDVALQHFKVLKGFENYRQYYAKREEAQGIYADLMRRSSSFAAFTDVS